MGLACSSISVAVWAFNLNPKRCRQKTVGMKDPQVSHVTHVLKFQGQLVGHTKCQHCADTVVRLVNASAHKVIHRHNKLDVLALPWPSGKHITTLQNKILKYTILDLQQMRRVSIRALIFPLKACMVWNYGCFAPRRFCLWHGGFVSPLAWTFHPLTNCRQRQR